MFKKSQKRSNVRRRVRVTTSAARSHANATTGLRPIVPRPIVSEPQQRSPATTVTEQGTRRPRVDSPQQPTELAVTCESISSRGDPLQRSHLQGRENSSLKDIRMIQVISSASQTSTSDPI